MGQNLSLALFQAASNDDTERIRLLLGQGVDVNSKDEVYFCFSYAFDNSSMAQCGVQIDEQPSMALA